jgi:hypothetical protein
VEVENAILNPGIIEGFTFQIIDIRTTVVVYETIDQEGLNDDEIECVVIVKPVDVQTRVVLTEKFVHG